MNVQPNRLVYLGYGKYWRSDQIVGLVPIEEDRGPGRRTEVYVETLERPVIASRTEDAIRRDMMESSEESFRAGELRTSVAELIEELMNLSPVLRRMLLHEAGIDVRRWQERLQGLLGRLEPHDEEQEDLFETQ